MSKRYRLLPPYALALLLTLGSTGCSDASPPAPTPDATSAPAQTPTPAPATGSPVSADQLNGALLAAADVPKEFDFSRGTGRPPRGIVSSSDPNCAAFVALINDRTSPPNAAGVEFVAKKKSAAFGERLAPRDNPEAVGAVINSFRQAAASCHQLSVEVDGLGRLTGTMDQQKLENAGDDNSAVLIQSTSGKYAGYSVLFSEIQLGSVELSTYSLGLTGQAGGGAIKAALDKAGSKLPG